MRYSISLLFQVQPICTIPIWGVPTSTLDPDQSAYHTEQNHWIWHLENEQSKYIIVNLFSRAGFSWYSKPCGPMDKSLDSHPGGQGSIPCIAWLFLVLFQKIPNFQGLPCPHRKSPQEFWPFIQTSMKSRSFFTWSQCWPMKGSPCQFCM